MSEPLAGIRVLDLTRLLPGGYATLLLADLGADVLKIEEPGRGDYIRWTPPMVGEYSAAHIALNRDKRSMTLNLKSDEGRALFLRMVAKFDVVLESFRPGVMDRLGVGWEALRARRPDLVYCAITGYGQDGPRAQTAGHDLNYIGYAGVLSVTGDGGRPVIPALQIGDLAGGAMSAVIAILAALQRRASTGEGGFCDVAMTDGVVSWLSIHAADYFATNVLPQPGRMPLSGAYPCYRVYPASDGWITVAALEPQFWTVVCRLIERVDLANDAYATGERRDWVIAELEETFRSRTKAQWMKLFEGHDACVGPVNDLSETFEDVQVRHRAMVVESDDPGPGRFRHLGNPFKITGGVERPIKLPPPAMGEHTEEVLSEIGVDEAEAKDLRSSGVI